MRHCFSRLIFIAASWAVVSMAAAQTPVRPPKPYEPVAITRAAASDDATFIAFRAALTSLAKTRIYAELAALVLGQGFFWDRDFGQQFDPRKPSVDNLAAAIFLEKANGIGWDTLAAFAALDAVEPLESRPGVICAPARPAFDGIAYSRLLDTTYTSNIDWAYPRADETPVYATPRAGGVKVATVGAHFVRLIGFEGPDSEPAPGRNQWARIALPDGQPGFVPPGSLMSINSDRLCYIKEMVAGWRIAGYIAGGN